MLLILLVFGLHSRNYANGTDTLSRKEVDHLATILPKVVKDLQVCDLLKERVVFLDMKVEVIDRKNATLAKELETEKSGRKKDLRRFKIKSVVRTIAEVAVVTLTIIALSN